VRLLNKMSLLDVALNLACDAGQFDFALELCRASGKPADGVHLKLAMALEDEGKFEEAEQEFISADKPKEAIMMYVHTSDYKSALRIAYQLMPEAVTEILVQQANDAAEAKNYGEFEALMIRAERPELIVQHYKDNEMWPDAVRVAREYVPSLMADLQKHQSRSARSSATRSANSDSRSILQQASDYARNEDFQKAAECLLQINSQNADEATTERALIRAAEICNQFLEGDDAQAIARELGPRLVDITQIGPAAQLYLAADMPKEAVDVFINTENWGKARRLAKEIDAQFVAYVEAKQKSHLKNEGNIEQLADIGGDLEWGFLRVEDNLMIFLFRHNGSVGFAGRAGAVDAVY
jgi:intraflagellar transport protein 172